MPPGAQRDSLAEFSTRLLDFGDTLREHTEVVRRVEKKIDNELPVIRTAVLVSLLLSVAAGGYSVWSRYNPLEKDAVAAPATRPGR